MEKLGLKRMPEQIECFDISNIGGRYAVGAMVTFVDITAIEASLDAILARIAGTTLNDLSEFSGLNPSIERLAEIFCRSALAGMAVPTLSAISVKVFESGSAWASCRRELP